MSGVNHAHIIVSHMCDSKLSGVSISQFLVCFKVSMSKISAKTDKLLLNYSNLFWGHRKYKFDTQIMHSKCNYKSHSR